MYRKLIAVSILTIILQSYMSLAAIPTNKGKTMNRTDICKENFEKLFKAEALTTSGSDPEMMSILQKFIFGEVFTIGNLDIKPEK